MRFTFSPVALSDEALDKLRIHLSGKRRPELEDYYWQLAGESEDNREIRLVAMMCDHCEMQQHDGTLTVELTRLLQIDDKSSA